MRGNNKGLSLVELLVVMAISTIVMLLATSLIVNSSRMYSRESNTIDVQNEAQLIVNNLNEALMEANKLEVTRDTNATLVILGTKTSDNKSETKSYCRHLFFNGDKKFLGLIVAASQYDAGAVGNEYLEKDVAMLAGDSSEKLDGYQLSSIVTDFRITYDPTCYKGTSVPDSVTGAVTELLTNPVKVKCKFTISTATYSYDYEVSVQLRNSFSEVKLPSSLANQDDIVTYKVVDR